jgi:phosphatidylserine synthase
MAFSSNQGFLALATIVLGYLMVSNLKIKKL